MKNLLFSTAQLSARAAGICWLLLAVGLSASAQSKLVTVTMPELAALTRQWSGSLTYQDYGTHESVTLPTALLGRQTSHRQFVLHFTYQEPSGKQVTGTDTLRLAPDGAAVQWDNTVLRVRSKTMLPGQQLQLVLEGEGQDDNKVCLIRKTVLLSPSYFSVVKQVRFVGAEAFLTRNSYLFQK